MPRRIRLLLALALAACLVAVPVALAGGEDPSATEPLGVHLERTGFASVAARDDGSLLALQVGGKEFGRRIESFGPDGTPIADGLGQAPPESRLFPVSGGRYLALGYQKMTMLESDGTVDRTFGDAGSVVAPLGAKAAFQLGSGKIAVVGTDVNGAKSTYSSATVTLLNPDGSDAKGSYSPSFSLSEHAPGSSVAVPQISPLANGGALVVGQDFLLELDADGGPVRGFGKRGAVTGLPESIGGGVLPDGLIETVAHEAGRMSLSRYTAAGKPDLGFGKNGTLDVDLGAEPAPSVASWAADGSVIVGGRLRASCGAPECEEVPFLAAFDAGGARQASFADGGLLKLSSLAGLPEGSPSPGVTAIASRPDGSIVAAGAAGPNETTGFLAAVTSQGALVPGFGEGGIARRPEALRASQEVVGFAPTADGGLIAAGTTDVGIGDSPILVRYRPDLTLDRSFGGGTGYVDLRHTPDGSPHGATGFAFDGEDVLVGNYDTPFSHIFMAHASDGSPVQAFGSGGRVDLPSETFATQLAFAGNGDPLVLGIDRRSGPAANTLLLRYRPDGSLATDFADQGRFTMRLDGRYVRWRSLLGGPGEPVILAGSQGRRFVLTSLMPDGRPDPKFGVGGSAVVKVPEHTHYATVARIGSYLYVAGTYGSDRDEVDLALMRFDRHGHLDRSFGRGGIRFADLDEAQHPVTVLPTPAGPLVVMGTGRRPLITFKAGGKVARAPAGPSSGVSGDVRAAPTGSGITVGWTTYSPADRAQILHLANRPPGAP